MRQPSHEHHCRQPPQERARFMHADTAFDGEFAHHGAMAKTARGGVRDHNLSAAGRQFERMPVLGVSTSREALLRCVQPSPLKRRTWPRYCRDGAAGSGGLSGSRSMRAVCFSLVVCVLGAGLAGAARADDFMKECLVTSSQKMCDCISAKLPADKRAAAIDGMRKSNAATQPGGNP